MHSKKIRIKNKIIQKKNSKIRRIAALLCLFLTGGLYGCSGTGEAQKTELVSVQEEYQTETREQKNDAGNTAEDTEKEQTSKPVKPEKAQMYYVHVCGQVVKPGVYELPAGSRLYEAVVLAGGLTENAAGEGLNQAEKIEDGSRIYVPSKEEYAAAGQNSPEISGEVSVSGTADADDKVNLNTATKEQLMTLSGIGEAKALAIISYRESHGSFQKIEELMQVEGIKNGVFQKVKDQIKV